MSAAELEILRRLAAGRSISAMVDQVMAMRLEVNCVDAKAMRRSTCSFPNAAVPFVDTSYVSDVHEADGNPINSGLNV